MCRHTAFCTARLLPSPFLRFALLLLTIENEGESLQCITTTHDILWPTLRSASCVMSLWLLASAGSLCTYAGTREKVKCAALPPCQRAASGLMMLGFLGRGKRKRPWATRAAPPVPQSKDAHQRLLLRELREML